MLDRSGSGISGVDLKLQNGDYKTIATATSGTDGSYSFDQVPVPNGNDIFRVLGSFNVDGRNWTSGTAFFNVLALRITSQDVHFKDYPSSGVCCLYGVTTSDQFTILPVPATIYLDNGMFISYPGGKYDTWSFDKLPYGKYVVRAETNIGGETYTSQQYNVTLSSDEPAYLPIYLPIYIAGTNKVPYHSQPVQMKNIVHGVIVQKNGAPFPGAQVELYRVSGSGTTYVASATSNATGQYVFDGVGVDTPSGQFIVRVTYKSGDASQTQDSGVFTVYYANTLGVSHDIYVPVSLNIAYSGSMLLQSEPSGAAIFIDGVDIRRTTPCNVTGLMAGSHAISLLLDGYYADNFTVQLQPDTAATVNRTLRQNTGSTFLDIRPAGASVYLDGKFVGNSPVNLTKFAAGSHVYTVACDGYRNESGTIEIVSGESIVKEIDMVATPGISLTYIGYLLGSFIQQIFSMF